MLSLADMRKVIQNGGSVLYRNRLITKLTDLPTAAELAKGNPAAEADAAAELRQQVADLQNQLAALQGPPVSIETLAADDLRPEESGAPVTKKK